MKKQMMKSHKGSHKETLRRKLNLKLRRKTLLCRRRPGKRLKRGLRKPLVWLILVLVRMRTNHKLNRARQDRRKSLRVSRIRMPDLRKGKTHALAHHLQRRKSALDLLLQVMMPNRSLVLVLAPVVLPVVPVVLVVLVLALPPALAVVLRVLVRQVERKRIVIKLMTQRKTKTKTKTVQMPKVLLVPDLEVGEGLVGLEGL